jgi:hypothetical protein
MLKPDLQANAGASDETMLGSQAVQGARSARRSDDTEASNTRLRASVDVTDARKEMGRPIDCDRDPRREMSWVTFDS